MLAESLDPSRAASSPTSSSSSTLRFHHPELLALVDQALTHVSSGRARNLERLEFLGDAALRLAATEFIDRHHADLAVGARSNLRAQLVSDRWLADVGAALGIEQHLLLGGTPGDRSAESRLRADATEALIEALQPRPRRQRWLTPHWCAAQAVLATSLAAKQPCRSGARARAGTAQLRHRRMQPPPRRPRTLPLPSEHPGRNLAEAKAIPQGLTERGNSRSSGPGGQRRTAGTQ